jgi:uncharacterized membrane protein
MNKNPSTDVITRQTWLDPAADVVQKTTLNAFEKAGSAGRKIEDVLRGKWLGHPLHAALIDVPLGAWTTAVLLDAVESSTGREELRPGADAAIGIGLVGAIGAAVTGLTDYQHVQGSARRVGIVHGILNVVTLSCFTASYISRKRHSRTLGKFWGAAGFAIGMFAATLGGELVYNLKVGVKDARIAA